MLSLLNKAKDLVVVKKHIIEDGLGLINAISFLVHARSEQDCGSGAW